MARVSVQNVHRPERTPAMRSRRSRAAGEGVGRPGGPWLPAGGVRRRRLFVSSLIMNPHGAIIPARASSTQPAVVILGRMRHDRRSIVS